MAILAQGLGSKFLCCLFLKTMSVPMDIDKETEVTTQTKGKGGTLLSTTSAFFEARYRDVEDKETQVQQCLATDGRVLEDGDEDMMVTKTLIDGMEPEAHANAILATDFQEAGTFEDPELTAALKRMSISEDGSWQDADRFTETSEDTDPGWTKVRQVDTVTTEARYHGGAGAGSPAAGEEGDPRSRSPRTLESQGHRGGAGLGRGVYVPNQATITPTKRFTPASSSLQQPKLVKLQRIGMTDKYMVTSLPESFPYLNETGKRLTMGMTEKEFGNLFLQFSTGALDTIVVQRILETYKVQKSKETMLNIMKQPHRRTGDRAGLGAKPLHELKTEEDRPPMVCADCGSAWKENARKCWVCGSLQPMTIREYEQREEDSKIVTIGGKQWRMTLHEGHITWENADARDQHMGDKQGQVDGCTLAAPPPCPTLETDDDLAELTMADQVGLNHRIHIRQEILDNRPDREEKDHIVKARAKTTDDIDPTQSFQLWHPEYERADRIQTKIMHAGGTQQKKDIQAAKSRREMEAVKVATQSIHAQQQFLADFQEGMLEVKEEDITNPAAKAFRTADLEKTKQHLLAKLMEGKPTSLVDAIMANQDTEDKAREANKRLQEEGAARMNKHRVYSEPMEVWPPNIQLMVERGYFNPKEESPLKNHDWREDIVDKYNQMKSALKYGQPAGAAKLFTEMPLPSERPQGTPGTGAGAGSPAALTQEVNLTEEDKTNILRTLIQLNHGQARLTGGKWTKVRHAEGDIVWPTWAEGKQLDRRLLISLEARTHPYGSRRSVDSVTGVFYDDDEVREAQEKGDRPTFEDMVDAFWARGNDTFSWRRECMTWDLPSLIGIHGSNHSLRTLYNYWCDLPIAINKSYRGKNAPDSNTALRQKNWHQAQKKCVDFMKSVGIPHPETASEWKLIVSEMGRWMAMSVIHSGTPAAVMELPLNPTSDNKDAMQFRASCDERITLPAELFRDTPIHERVEKLQGGGTVEVRRYWRCNTSHEWAAEVKDVWLASALMVKLGYKDREIREEGLPPPGAGPRELADGGAPILKGQERGERHTMPPISPSNVTAKASKKWKRENGYQPEAQVFWAHAECGLVLPSVSCWEVVGRQVGVTRGGYMCSYCKGFWRAKGGGTRFLQLSGRKADQRVRLQLILDEPPLALENKWIKERVEYYMRCEPHAPPRDERMEASGGARLRFSHTNGMGHVGELLWNIILSNPEKPGLAKIHGAAQKAVK